VPKVVKEYGQIQGKCFHHSTFSGYIMFKCWLNNRTLRNILCVLYFLFLAVSKHLFNFCWNQNTV